MAAAQAQELTTRQSRPNLILCMADELRAESVACYGHPLVKTPNLDKLASEGVRFAQCHVQNPVCDPRAAVFSPAGPCTCAVTAAFITACMRTSPIFFGI